MRIVVCVKNVPDIHAERRLTENNRVDRDPDDSVLNELDENAIEEALTLIEGLDSDGPHELIALTVGPKDALASVRKALQLGAARGVHVSDEAIAGSDAFGTAKVLAAAVGKIHAETPVDLVFTGMASLDGVTSLVPSAVAAELNWPQATLASEVILDDAAAVVRVKRELDHVVEQVEAPLPAVVSVTDQINEPRYPNFRAIMGARKKPVETLALADLGLAAEQVGDAAARTRVLSAAARPERERGTIIIDSGDGGKQLAQWLVDQNLA